MTESPDKNQVLETVQQYCGDAVGLSSSEVLAGYDLREDLGMSPIELGEVLARLQEKYAFTIPKENFKETVDELTTVESLVTIVEDELEL